MSKFSNAIKATITGNVKVAQNFNYLKTNMKSSEPAFGNTMKQVLLEAKFTCDCYLPGDIYNGQLSQDDQVFKMTHDIKRAMVEELFGEFRGPIIEIQSAIYAGDFIRLRTLLAELESSMFNV